MNMPLSITRHERIRSAKRFSDVDGNRIRRFPRRPCSIFCTATRSKMGLGSILLLGLAALIASVLETSLLAQAGPVSSEVFPAHYRLVREQRYPGMCDASGAVPITPNTFAVACDEDNVLRVYRNDAPAQPIKELDCNAFLGVRGKSLEADLEAAARIGDRIFWMGSHGRNRRGKERQNRDRFFATDIRTNGADMDLILVGRPYERLVDDLVEDSRLEKFHFGEASRYAPKEWAALNIEGLASTQQGGLLIGFRNPIPQNKALIIPMLNPNEVVQGEQARLGAPILLDLGGLGIRDIAFYAGSYLIIAGSYDGSRDFRLYRWAGGEAIPERIRVKHLNDYHPEALIIYPDKGAQQVQVLSDDGTLKINGMPCKETPVELRGFRSFWLTQ